MPRAGSVKDSSLSSPRTPKAPWIRPRSTRFGEAVSCADGAFIVEYPETREKRGPRSARPRASGRGGGLARLVQVGDLVAHLRTMAQPVLDALDIELDPPLGAGGDRVEVTDALDVAAIAGAAAVGDDDVVEGALLGAATGEADLDHGALGVAQLPGWQGKPAIIKGFRPPGLHEGPAPAHHPLHAAHQALHAAAAHLRHHLFHLLVLLQQLVDVRGSQARAGGDALAPGTVQQGRVAALLLRHRVDDRHHPRPLLAGDLGLDRAGAAAAARERAPPAG